MSDIIMSENLIDDQSDHDENYLEDKILAQALPVTELKKDIDLNIPPATGEDYLSRVRYEASKISKVVVANVDVKKFEKNRTTQYFQPDLIEESRKEFKAPLEWQYEKSNELSQTRDRVRKEKDDFLKFNQNKNMIKFPKLKNKNEWYTYLFGKKGESDHHQRPLLSILYNMDQPTIVQLFDYFVEWIEEYGYSQELFEWTYSLLCFIEKPLLPETHSSLRTLARTCINLRSELTDPNNPYLMPLNLFISLIGRYFEQLDLADKD